MIVRWAGWLVVAGVVVLATATLPAPAPPSVPIFPLFAVPVGGIDLSNDGGGTTFRLDGLVPSRPVSTCLSVRYANALSPSAIYLYVIARRAALAPYVSLVIEVGAGGGHASCAGFTATEVVYQDTLARLIANHHDSGSGLPVLRVGDAEGQATFRITVVVHDDNAAQNLDADFDLVWSAPASDAVVAPVPGPAPLASAPAASPAAPSASATAASPAVPSASASRSAPGNAGSAEPSGAHGDRSVMRQFFDTVTGLIRKAAGPVAAATSIGAFSGLIVAAFILIQDRIDRRDPKLSLAPLRPPVDLLFSDRTADS